MLHFHLEPFALTSHGVVGCTLAAMYAGLVGCIVLCLVVASLEAFTMYVLAKVRQQGRGMLWQQPLKQTEEHARPWACHVCQ